MLTMESRNLPPQQARDPASDLQDSRTYALAVAMVEGETVDEETIARHLIKSTEKEGYFYPSGRKRSMEDRTVPVSANHIRTADENKQHHSTASGTAGAPVGANANPRTRWTTPSPVSSLSPAEPAVYPAAATAVDPLSIWYKYPPGVVEESPDQQELAAPETECDPTVVVVRTDGLDEFERGGRNETPQPGQGIDVLRQPMPESSSKFPNRYGRIWLAISFAATSAVVALIAGVTAVLAASANKDIVVPSIKSQGVNSDQPEVMEPANDKTSMIDDKVAIVPVDICMEQVPGDGRSLLCSREETSQRGGAVCNLVAKAMLHRLPGAHFAIQNAGSCVKDIPRGNFSAKDALEVIPGMRSLISVQLRGAQAVLLLEEALESALGTGTIDRGAYPYAAGIRYNVNATASFQNRLSDVEINPGLDELAAWTPIDLEATYLVLMHSGLIEDGPRISAYEVFSDIPPDYFHFTRLDVLESFLRYAREKSVLLNPLPREYSTQSFARC